MTRFKYKFNVKDNKILILSIIFVVLLVVSIAIPTLSKYKELTSVNTITVWDGTMANSYDSGDGTLENPYVISNGSELLYFASQLKSKVTNYEGEYFILSNDIILNDGMFEYTNEGGIKYIKDNNIVTISNEINDVINVFEKIDGFKGEFNGQNHTVYGLYIDEALNDQNALFTNLEGNISNLYIKNSIIYGGEVVGGVASSANNSVLTNVTFDGFVVSDGAAAGIVSNANNTVLKNIINKADVYGASYASGIVNVVSGESSLENVYNTGSIESTYMALGLVSSVKQNEGNVIIVNCYNSGVLYSVSSAFIGNIEDNTGNVSISNCFDISSSFAINLINNSNVDINKFYTVSGNTIKEGNYINDGNNSESFVQTTIENLKNKDFVKTNLGYEEYTEGNEILSNVWVWNFDIDSLPILYIDDLNRPIAEIHINNYMWDEYQKSLDILKFSNRLVFSIEESSSISNIKDIYYYVSNEKTSLSKEAINAISTWNKYEGIIDVEEEGFYVVYAKIIDDNNNEIYINTDLLVIDLTGSDITISTSYSSDEWNTFQSILNNYYIDREISVNVKAEDNLSGINKVYYYVSSEVLSQNDLDNFDKWQEYNGEFTLKDAKNIVYVKTVDNCGFSTYANSDLIILNGYRLESISPGMNGTSSSNIYVTDKSSVSLNYLYKDSNTYSVGGRHQIVSNILLPESTKLTIIDKNKSKVYTYVTTDSNYNFDGNEAIYDFTLFKELGSQNNFDENDYVGEIDENFVLIVDFTEAKVNENIQNIVLSMRIVSDNVNEIRKTLVDSVNAFNVIYDESKATFELATTFEDIISYNENSLYTVDLNAKVNYQTINGNKIFDTTYEDKNLGLAVKLVNSNGEIVSKQYLKNLSFKIGDKKYSPSSDGIIRINLENGIKDIENELIIQTNSDNTGLVEGNYKLILSLYASYDGINSNDSLSKVEIPVYVGENVYKVDNSFNVVMDSDDKIVSSGVNEFDFELLISTLTEKTNVRVSLYKKDSPLSTDLSYSMINISDYLLDGSFIKNADKIIYYVSGQDESNKLKLNLDTSLLKKNGYMFVFELYEEDKLVNKISKKFIVK